MTISESVTSPESVESKPILFIIETLLPDESRLEAPGQAAWIEMPAYFLDGEYADGICAILNGAEPGSYRVRGVSNRQEADKIIAEFIEGWH